MSRIQVSVVIPTVRSRWPKRGLLYDLVSVLPAANVPVVEVVLAGCWPRRFLKDFDRLNLRLVPLPCHALERSVLRNKACSRARGTHFFFLDDDTIPVPGPTFQQQLRALRRGELLTFATRRYLHMDGWSDAQLHELMLARAYDTLTSAAGPSTAHEGPEITTLVSYATNVGIIDAATFHKLGGFDAGFRGWGFEDVEFMNRVIANADIVSCRDSCVSVHLDHLVSPYRHLEGLANFQMQQEKRRAARAHTPYTAEFFALIAQYIGRLRRFAPHVQGTISHWLQAVPYLRAHRGDLRHAAAWLLSRANAIDLLAVGIYGSGSVSTRCRDIDLCLVSASDRSKYESVTLPSGKLLELHYVSIWSIREQLLSPHKYGDNAGVIHLKWRCLRLLYDFAGIVHALTSEWGEAPASWAYLLTLYIGLSLIYLKKRPCGERLCLGRYLGTLAALGGERQPTTSVILNTREAERWLARICEKTAPRYARLMHKVRPEAVTRFPPNVLGDATLRACCK